MINMTVLINQLIQLFLIIGMGFLAYKAKILNEHANKIINIFILNITLPLMMINSVLSMTEHPSFSSVSMAFIASIIFYGIIPVIAFIVVKFLLKTIHIKKSRQGVYMFMFIFSNVGFMGIPILQATCGNQGNTAIFYAAILNIFFNISAFTYGVIMIESGSASKSGFKLKSLLSPGIVSSLLAIFLYAFNINFPAPISGAISAVGNLTSPLAMIMVGSTLASIKFREVFCEWKIYVFTILKQFIIPILLYPVFRLFLGKGLLFNVMFIEFLMPVANTALMLSAEYDCDTQFISKTIFLSTALSLITMPLTLHLCNIIY